MSERSNWPAWKRSILVLREEGLRGVASRVISRANAALHQLIPASPDALYDTAFFHETRIANAYTDGFGEWIISNLEPKSVLDVGCGDGRLVGRLAEFGVDACGLDGSSTAVGALPKTVLGICHNLTKPFVLSRRFSLVISIEVAEHLPRRSADPFVQSLVAHAADALLFSAAHPGQGGHDHLNEQPLGYWVEKFAKLQFGVDHGLTRLARNFLQQSGAPAYLCENLIVLKRRRPTSE